MTSVRGMSSDHGLRVIDRTQQGFAAPAAGLVVTAPLTLRLEAGIGNVAGVIALFAGSPSSALTEATVFPIHASRLEP